MLFQHLTSRKAGVLMNDCFPYFSPGSPETYAQQNEVGMELPWRRVDIGNQAKGTQSEDLSVNQAWAI